MGTLKTFTGRFVDPFNMKVDDIDIEDISKALSNLCRFAGHVEFYSVAQHSYYCCMLAESMGADEDTIKACFAHDFSEAYATDLPRPIKKFIPSYIEMENKIQEVIAEKFNLPYPFPAFVHIIDNAMLSTELKQLQKVDGKEWASRSVSEKTDIIVDIEIKPMLPKEAYSLFINEYSRRFLK